MKPFALLLSLVTLPVFAQQWQCEVKETYVYKTGKLTPGTTPGAFPKRGDRLEFDPFWGRLDIIEATSGKKVTFALNMWQQPEPLKNSLTAGRVFVGTSSTAVTLLRIDTLESAMPFFLYHLDEVSAGNCKLLGR